MAKAFAKAGFDLPPRAVIEAYVRDYQLTTVRPAPASHHADARRFSILWEDDEDPREEVRAAADELAAVAPMIERMIAAERRKVLAAEVRSPDARIRGDQCARRIFTAATLGRAPRRATNTRTRGSRRTAASRGDPDELGDKPPGHRRLLIGGRR
jgi:hypothetical protein